MSLELSMFREEVRPHWRLVALVAVSYSGILFAGVLSRRSNTVLYGSVIMALIVAFGIVHLHVGLPDKLLWALALLGLLHLAGGLIPLGEGQILYNMPLGVFPLQVDRVVHAFGSAVVALVAWQAVRGHLIGARPIPWLVVLAGMGVGAIEEVAEFASSSVAPSNVGGYSNTGWDLVFNLVGCTVAAAWVRLRGTVAAPAMMASAERPNPA
jgi:hypothetical protein